MLALLLVALSLGLSNFAAAVGIGVAGVDAGTRLRVGLIFGLFEAGMPLLGLLLGHSLAHTLGDAAHWIGAALLIATGIYAVAQAIRSQASKHDKPPAEAARQGTGRLLVTGIALSIDNLAVGFALGAFHVNLAVAAITIGVVSVTLSLIGLDLGDRLGSKTGEQGELLGGLDITAETEAARLVVTGQMIADLITIGLAVKVIVGAVRQGRQRQPVGSVPGQEP